MSNSARPPAASPQGASASVPVGPVTTCMLLIGDRVVLRANAPPEAEYLLFEIADIELRTSDHGRVREHGYQTTVERARARLQQLGITAELARECAVTMHPAISSAYARGPGVRHIARYLGPLELFQADVFNATTQTYHGVFLDLPSLVTDLDLPSASIAFQALFLATLLETEADGTTVFLSTDAWTKHRKPGERSHKRLSLATARPLRTALAELAERNPRTVVRDQLARADIIAFLRARADAAGDEDGRALYASLERAIAVRDMPERGPLAEPELWAIETRLDTSNFDNILFDLEEVERVRGRTPGTTYLRARASLALQLEPPKLIAERVSALALSMTSFQELSLLAAEAWLEAGDPRRAMPYARDLVDAPGIDEGLLLRAKRILARAVGAAPDKHQTYADSIPVAPLPASHLPPKPTSQPPRAATTPGMGIPPPLPARARSQAPMIEAPPTPMPSAPPQASLPPLPPPAAPPPRTASRASSSYKSSAPRTPGISVPPPDAPRPMRARSRAPSPPPLELELPEMPEMPEMPDMPDMPDMPEDVSASFTLDLPSPDSAMPPTLDAPRQTPSNAPQDGAGRRGPVRRQSMGAVSVETRAPPAYDPRAEPDSADGQTPSAAVTEARDSRRKRGSSRPPPLLDAALPPESSEEVARALDRERSIQRVLAAQEARVCEPSTLGTSPPPPIVALKGASLPPFRLESPAPLLPKAPLMPKLGGAADELAEHLPLPAGLGNEPGSSDELPKSVLEARVAFTLLARELGLDYRLKRGIELRADVSGIEAMQSVLLESFPDRVIRTSDDSYELRRHGALLSEILARRLDAEWIDISPNELGYWAMIIPPDTRVWPFGRVARLVDMGHKERDLVSFFFEIQSRARAR